MPTPLVNSMLAPVSQLLANTAQLVTPQQKEAVAHLADPMKAGDTAQDNIILNRFMGQFEKVELDFNDSYGELTHPERPLTTHPHLEFIMSDAERSAMSKDQINTHLSREVDRGNYMLQRLGLTTDDFYINTDRGLLRFDAKVPNPPEGLSERQVLESVQEGLQQAANQIRSQRAQAAASPAIG